jgi:hypothetical protein
MLHYVAIFTSHPIITNHHHSNMKMSLLFIKGSKKKVKAPLARATDRVVPADVEEGKLRMNSFVLYWYWWANRELLGVSATRRPSVRADPQGMQPG